MDIKKSKRITSRSWRILNSPYYTKRHDNLLAQQYKKTLEVGPAEGFFTIKLLRQGVDVVGVDISRENIETALNMFMRNGIGTTIYEADVNDMPFADWAFDTIICSEVLEHIHTPSIALKEMARVCRPGGHLYLTCPRKGLMPPGVTVGHVQDFSFGTLMRLIRLAGWEPYQTFVDPVFQYYYARRM
jgi:2-polyprenyl-3-methyl-5-hydroxy-6-metoxy-1,4-benzoquinol methylase